MEQKLNMQYRLVTVILRIRAKIKDCFQKLKKPAADSDDAGWLSRVLNAPLKAVFNNLLFPNPSPGSDSDNE